MPDLGSYLLIGAAAGGLYESVRMILEARRSEVIPAFKASKEFKQKLSKVAKDHGWSLSQTTYIVASFGLDAVLKEEAEKKPTPDQK